MAVDVHARRLSNHKDHPTGRCRCNQPAQWPGNSGHVEHNPCPVTKFMTILALISSLVHDTNIPITMLCFCSTGPYVLLIGMLALMTM